MKTTVNISVTPDTKERLRTYAIQRHTTISQAITDWIWQQEIKPITPPTEMEKKGD